MSILYLYCYSYYYTYSKIVILVTATRTSNIGLNTDVIVVIGATYFAINIIAVITGNIFTNMYGTTAIGVTFVTNIYFNCNKL